jgi:putative oxidoreductase
MALFAGLIQFAGGLLLAIGWLTRWVSAALILFLAVTAWKMHALWGFFINWTGEPTRGHGLEYALVLAGALGCLALAGGGDWSIDGRRSDRAAMRAAAGRARLRRG